jgi:hypothetical protein
MHARPLLILPLTFPYKAPPTLPVHGSAPPPPQAAEHVMYRDVTAQNQGASPEASLPRRLPPEPAFATANTQEVSHKVTGPLGIARQQPHHGCAYDMIAKPRVWAAISHRAPTCAEAVPDSPSTMKLETFVTSPCCRQPRTSGQYMTQPTTANPQRGCWRWAAGCTALDAHADGICQAWLYHRIKPSTPTRKPAACTARKGTSASCSRCASSPPTRRGLPNTRLVSSTTRPPLAGP